MSNARIAVLIGAGSVKMSFYLNIVLLNAWEARVCVICIGGL